MFVEGKKEARLFYNTTRTHLHKNISMFVGNFTSARHILLLCTTLEFECDVIRQLLNFGRANEMSL